MKDDNVIVDKSKKFALRIIKVYQYLTTEKKEFILSKTAHTEWDKHRGECEGSCLRTESGRFLREDVYFIQGSE